ncbi:WG repeat-containing protein [Chryseobacterium sp. MEBOG06]|uniref:WG repeat-containing protein n=1 Tax=Chryseobacterium sp. MEBOG06 TaxID=2879938 RepID=UPI001F3C3534|nr:WG repeat-containing protein [Chryseobacterium sp. MEBOG06]UKB83978.1 WG repeat-containing protein [Chryseobacterium sp. MEBOG06]
MKKIIFVLCSVVCTAQTNQYMKVILSKKTGKEVNSYSDGYGTLYDPVSEKHGIVDSLGTVTFESPYKGSILHVFKNRFILYSEETNYTRKSAVINEKGKEFIPLNNQEFNTPWWSEEFIISSREGKEAVYDYNGKEIISYSDKIRFSGKNRFFVLKDKGWFLYDFNGKQVSARGFKDDYYFEEGRALITNDNNQSEIIDENGQTLHTFSKLVTSISSYPYLITQNKATGKYGLIDTEENTIADETFKEIIPEYFGKKEYIYLSKNNKTTVFYKKDKKLYSSVFKSLTPLFNNLFSIYNDKTKKSGIADLEGNIIVPQEYNFIQSFTISGRDVVYLKKEGEEKLLDKDLKNVINEDVDILGFYPEGLIVKESDKYYRFSLKDKSRDELKNISWIRNENNEYFNFLNPYSKPLVCKNKDNFYGILDGKGTEIVPFIYDDIIIFGNSENEIVVKKEGKYGVLNFQNELLKEIDYDKYSWQKEVLKLDKNKKTELIYFTRFRNNPPQL